MAESGSRLQPWNLYPPVVARWIQVTPFALQTSQGLQGVDPGSKGRQCQSYRHSQQCPRDAHGRQDHTGYRCEP